MKLKLFTSLLLVLLIGSFMGCNKHLAEQPLALNELHGKVYLHLFGVLLGHEGVYLRRVASVSEGQLKIIKKTSSLIDENFRFENFAVSADGSRFVFFNHSGFIITDQSGNQIQEYKSEKDAAFNGFQSAVWDHTGETIYFAHFTDVLIRNISKYDVAEKKVTRLTNYSKPCVIGGLLALDDGQRLIFSHKFINPDNKKIYPENNLDLLSLNIKTNELTKLNLKGASFGRMAGSNNFLILESIASNFDFAGKTEVYLWDWETKKHLFTIKGMGTAAGLWKERKIIYSHPPQTLTRKIYLFDMQTQKRALINTPERLDEGSINQILEIAWNSD